MTLVVKPARFSTLNLTLPDDKVFLSPENLRRAQEEKQKLRSLFQVVSEKLWDGSFVIPLANEFSTAFGTKRIMNKKRISIHRGLYIRGKKEETVKASNHGRVVLAEELFFGGNTVIIDHGQGIYTIYMHLSEFKVKPEEIIAGIKDGFYLAEAFGLHAGINGVTGDFSLPVAGFKIENGQKTFPIRGVTIGGNLFDFLKSVDKIGDDLTWAQATGCPTFSVEKIKIGGV